MHIGIPTLPCKILSGQLSNIAVWSDPKFQKQPNFFFKRAKLVECFCKKCQNNPSGNSHAFELAYLEINMTTKNKNFKLCRILIKKMALTSSEGSLEVRK